MKTRTLALIGAAWLVLGCADSTLDPDESPGELGNGAFRYTCFDTEDPACPDGMTAETFPAGVGVGATFKISYEESSPGPTSAFKIQAASDRFLTKLDQGFRANGEGFAGLFARRTSDSSVIDIIHLRIAEVDELQIRTDDNKPVGISMAVGETQTLRTKTRDRDGNTLAGSRDFDWKLTGEPALKLEFASPSAVMEVTAVAAGKAQLTVTTADVTNSYDITVEGPTQ